MTFQYLEAKTIFFYARVKYFLKKENLSKYKLCPLTSHVYFSMSTDEPCLF